MMTYNLLSEPWLPVQWRDGSPPTEVGLREALLRAPDIIELATDNPLETVSLNRLLLALVASAFPELAREEAWLKCWQDKGFDKARLDEYLTTKIVARFDLLSPTRPFYGHPDPETKEVSPMTRLLHASASGNNATLFSHDMDNEAPPMSFAASARAVVCNQSAALGGGIAKPFNFCHAPLVGSAFFWLRGRPGNEATLFEALLLNLPPTTSVWGENTGKDAPAWEHEEPPVAEKRDARGLKDLITFQSRRLRLVIDAQGQAKGVHYNQGSKLGKLPFDDPFLAYQAGKEGPYPVRFSAGKALWRDSTVFLLAQTRQEERNRGVHPPRTFDWLATANAELLGLGATAHLEADVFGLVSDQAKIELWRQERITVYPEIIRDEDRWDSLQKAIEETRSMAGRLRAAVQAFATRARLGKSPEARLGEVERRERDEFVRAIDAENRYWPAFSLPFNTFLSQVATYSVEGLPDLEKEWRQTTYSIARQVLQGALQPHAHDARTCRALAEAENVLARTNRSNSTKQTPAL